MKTALILALASVAIGGAPASAITVVGGVIPVAVNHDSGDIVANYILPAAGFQQSYSLQFVGLVDSPTYNHVNYFHDIEYLFYGSGPLPDGTDAVKTCATGSGQVCSDYIGSPNGFNPNGRPHVLQISIQRYTNFIIRNVKTYDTCNQTHPMVPYDYCRSNFYFQSADIFKHADAPNGGSWTLTSYDAVAVPEPGLWVLMIAGFAAIGSVMRRRVGYGLLQ